MVMVPAERTRYWRKGLRKARRGEPTGRRATHRVVTTYGHRQREGDRLAAWQQMIAQAKANAEAA